MEVGARIEQARKESGGLTQRELAERLGVSERSVQAYESGEVVPYRFIRQLEELLGRPAEWILHGVEPRDDPSNAVAELRQHIDSRLDKLELDLEALRAAIKTIELSLR
jgi:transcriptional regulator with XRE-family HTH domain